MPDYDYKNGGFRRKYNITKTNGNPVDKDAVYFVLRLDKDPHALKALLTYASSVESENDVLAYDLFMLAEKMSVNYDKITTTSHET